MKTLKLLSLLLSYPTAELVEALPEIARRLGSVTALRGATQDALAGLLAELRREDLLDLQERYVAQFDAGRSTSLHLFEHVHGDSRDRGPAMIDLARMYEQAGLFLADGEMPDHLPVVIEFASTQPPREAAAFLGEIAHLLNVIFNALEQRRSRYASVVGALLDLAGEPSRPVTIEAEEPLDASWAEPAAFDGCSSAGQARPATPQPVQIVRRTAAPNNGVHA
jgi:nitrate reductase delta subunit